MSKFYDQADAIAATLATLTILSASRIAVDRQHDIVADLRKVVGKQIGNLILVSWAGGDNADESADGPQLDSIFNVTVFSKPVIRKDETSADDIAEAIANHLHDWRANATDHYYTRLICTGIFPQDLPELLAHQIRFKTRSQLES